MTVEQHSHTPHDDYYRRLKAEAAQNMKYLSGFSVDPKRREDVRDCIIVTLEKGTTFEVAEVLMNAIEWLHSCHEQKEHNNI